MSSAPGRWRHLDRSGVPQLAARLLVGGTFLWLGAAKAGDPVAFLKLLREYAWLPDDLPWLLNGLAVTLPWVEMLAGLLVLLGVGLRGSTVVLAVLLAVFSLAIAQRALAIQAAEAQPFCDIAFDCGCGSGVERVCRKLPENLALLLLCLLVLTSRSRRFCLLPRLFPVRDGPTLVRPPDPMEAS